MSAYSKIQDLQLQARKLKNQIAVDIYGLILGECQTKDDFSDGFVLTFVQKLVQSNAECLAKRDDVKLRRENDLLKDLLPSFSLQDVERLANDLDLPSHKGKATGMIMKAARAAGLVPNVEVVAEYLK